MNATSFSSIPQHTAAPDVVRVMVVVDGFAFMPLAVTGKTVRLIAVAGRAP